MDPYEKSKVKTKRYHKLKKLLKKIYGYDSFRSRQYEIINRIISGEDVCAILPTGMGKSLCYQLPALYLEKPAIVVSPLISLMDDQRLILEDLGLTSCCYNSNVTGSDKAKMRKKILKGKYQFVYITPESIVVMQEFLQDMDDKIGISLIAIDEAHCISSYGYDFRKAYREINFIKDILPDTPILAVTATATQEVGRDICRLLRFDHVNPIKTSFDRPNLYLQTQRKTKSLGNDIVPILKKYPNESIIIYCLTKRETAKIMETVRAHKIDCVMYHAGMDPEDKAKSHHDFVKGTVKVIAATIAFGMGINKADVRVVIHYGCPKNIEGYYQEIGRAGRDGIKSYCYAFYSPQDFHVQQSFIANADPSRRKLLQSLFDHMKLYMQTQQCRRRLLLEYFDEDPPQTCNFCDNCCGVDKKISEASVSKTTQDVAAEAKMLINLIESISAYSYGINTYINILRGSNAKTITSTLKKNKYYGEGRHRSTAWWNEMCEGLITQGFLQSVYLKSSRFPMRIVKTTQQGITWANLSDLNDYLDGLPLAKLKPIQMTTTV